MDMDAAHSGRARRWFRRHPAQCRDSGGPGQSSCVARICASRVRVLRCVPALLTGRKPSENWLSAWSATVSTATARHTAKHSTTRGDSDSSKHGGHGQTHRHGRQTGRNNENTWRQTGGHDRATDAETGTPGNKEGKRKGDRETEKRKRERERVAVVVHDVEFNASMCLRLSVHELCTGGRTHESQTNPELDPKTIENDVESSSSKKSLEKLKNTHNMR